MPSAFRRAGASKKKPTVIGADGTASASSDNATATSQSLPSRQRATTPSSLRGVKPWQGGSYLTSVGLNDLDTILGGGQPLQTCILLEEDRWSRDLALSLVKYWCAEALSQDQLFLAPVLMKPPAEEDDEFFGASSTDQSSCTDLESLLLSLPRNLHWDKHKKKAEEHKKKVDKQQTSDDGQLTKQMAILDILEEEGEEEDQDEDLFPSAPKDDDEGLVVAWQYKQSVQQERLATASAGSASGTALLQDVFCHSYDLSGRMSDQEKPDYAPLSSIISLPLSSKGLCLSQQQWGIILFRNLIVAIKDKLSSSQGKALRLLLFHPSADDMAVALPLLLAHIRKETLPVVILVCTPPIKNVSSWIQLARTSDAVLSTEGFASRRKYPPPPEFRHLQGVLKIAKTTRKLTEVAALVYGFKRDRRKLHIQLLHIPPEDYAEGGGSVGAGGVRSGAGRPTSKLEGGQQVASRKAGTSTGMGCSSNLSVSALDF